MRSVLDWEAMHLIEHIRPLGAQLTNDVTPFASRAAISDLRALHFCTVIRPLEAGVCLARQAACPAGQTLLPLGLNARFGAMCHSGTALNGNKKNALRPFAALAKAWLPTY